MCSSRDAWHTSSATVSATFNFSCIDGRGNSLMLFSASSMILAIICTASIGYFPEAVSAESITASEPSKFPRARDDHFLHHRHALRAHLHAKVAARHHHAVGGAQNGVQIFDGFRFF